MGRGGWLGGLRLRGSGSGRRRVEGGTDGAAPGVGAEGVDVFVLGEVEGLHEALREVGEGGGGFAVYVALSDGDEEAAEGVVEVAGGDVGSGEVGGDVLADVVGGEVLGFLTGVEGAEVGVAGAAGHAALVAVGESEGAGMAFGLGRSANLI